MQDLQDMIKNSMPNNEADDVEVEDEFDSYMEEALMQEADSLGIFDANNHSGIDVYSQALRRVAQEVAKVPAQGVEEEKKSDFVEDGEDFEKFGDDFMTKMMQEGSENQSNYVTEYNEVIAEISQICNKIMVN